MRTGRLGIPIKASAIPATVTAVLNMNMISILVYIDAISMATYSRGRIKGLGIWFLHRLAKNTLTFISWLKTGLDTKPGLPCNSLSKVKGMKLNPWYAKGWSKSSNTNLLKESGVKNGLSKCMPFRRWSDISWLCSFSTVIDGVMISVIIIFE